MKKYRLLKVPLDTLSEYYMVSDDGRVFSLKSKRFLTTRKNWAGYHMVHLRHKKISKVVAVHRLVGRAFLGEAPFDTAQIDHIDNNKNNNSADNLQWVSPSYNVKKAFSQGRKSPKGNSKTNRKGWRSPCAKLNETQIAEVKELLYKKTMKQKDIARKFQVSPQNISNIKKGRTYADV